MNPEIFIDTSGFYALLVKRDAMHKKASGILRKAAADKTRFITTDYILDETATLLNVRGHPHLLSDFFESIFTSKACRIEWMDHDRFLKTRKLFLKHHPHDWSFTDCFSFITMKELGIYEALSKDKHFRNAGFHPLLV